MNKLKGLLLFLFATCAFAFKSEAQMVQLQDTVSRYLALDKPGKVKRIRFYAGDWLTFRLKGDKTSYSAQITNVLPEAVAFGDALIPLSEFSAIRYAKDSYWANMARVAAENGQVAGIAFSGLGLIGTAAAPANRNVRSLLWGGLAVLSSSQLMKLFYFRTYRLNNYRRLHTIEAPYADAAQRKY